MTHITLSWKTTSAGALSILTAAIRYYFHVKSGEPVTEEFMLGTITLLMTGLGLIFAKDSNVTGSPAKDVDEVTTVTKLKEPEPPKPGSGTVDDILNRRGKSL